MKKVIPILLLLLISSRAFCRQTGDNESLLHKTREKIIELSRWGYIAGLAAAAGWAYISPDINDGTERLGLMLTGGIPAIARFIMSFMPFD